MSLHVPPLYSLFNLWSWYCHAPSNKITGDEEKKRRTQLELSCDPLPLLACPTPFLKALPRIPEWCWQNFSKLGPGVPQSWAQEFIQAGPGVLWICLQNSLQLVPCMSCQLGSPACEVGQGSLTSFCST